MNKNSSDLTFFEKNLRAVFFDWDMTLADTDQAFYMALEKTLSDYGLEPSNLHEYKASGGAKQTLEKRYGLRSMNPELYLRLKSNYFPTNVKLFPKTRETLLCLKKSGVSTFVISNKPHEVLDKELSMTGLKPIIHGFIGDTPERPKKPAPDNLVYAAKVLGIPLSSCLMVGDHTNDLVAARSAGIPVLLLGEESKTLSGDFWCKDIGDVPDLILWYFKRQIESINER